MNTFPAQTLSMVTGAPALVLALALALGVVVPSVAAAAPKVETASNHETTGSVVIAGDAEAVRRIVGDPVRVASIDQNRAKIEVEDEGRCKLLRTIVTHPIASIRYRARQCPLGDGFRTELVESGDLEEFHSEWNLRQVQGGVELTYKVRTIPRISVPQFLVDRQTRASVETLLTRVKDAVEQAK